MENNTKQPEPHSEAAPEATETAAGASTPPTPSGEAGEAPESDAGVDTKQAMQVTLDVTSHALKAEVEQLAGDLKATARAAAADVGASVSKQAQKKGEAVAQGVTTRTHDVKEAAADRIHETAESIRQRSVLPRAEAIDNVARRIDDASSYVRERDYTQMKGDFEHLVQAAPMVAVFMALLVGFLLGTLLKRG